MAVTSGVPQGSVLGSVLCITYINDINVGLNNFISKFADDTKVRNSITDRDMMSLQEEMPFHVNKCHILQAGTRNEKNDYEMRGTQL